MHALAGVLLTPYSPDALHVLVALRGDFLDAALADAVVGPVLSRQVYALGPMGGQQRRQAVAAPIADLPGIDYEPGLVDRILADTADEAAALPPLAFALSLLWQAQSGGWLTHQAYDRLGGVAGALATKAEEVWREHVPEGDEDAAHRLFTQLVRLPLGTGAVTRRVAARAELGEREWRIAQALATTRLLAMGRDAEDEPTVELAHEALLTGWPRLGRWVEADREFLGWREALRS